MVSPQIPLPRAAHSVRPTHLYRHLLRAASYLPPICATYVAARVKHQFRRHRDRRGHAMTHLTSGCRQLRRLQAANAGDTKNLHAVFLRTFGRVGHLRRTLIAPLVLPDPPATSEGQTTTLHTGRGDTNSRSRALYERARSDTRHKKNLVDRWDFDKLQGFVQSQMEHANAVSPYVMPRDVPTRPNPVSHIPEKNVWGRELPLRELRSRLKKWWVHNIAKVLPPLGEGEWHTLRDIAVSSETAQLLRPPRRRPVAASVHGEAAPPRGIWNWEAHASIPTSQIERERRAGFRESVDGFKYDPVPGEGRGVTGRKLRRAARRAFEASPYIKRDESTARSTVVWGNITPNLRRASPSSSSFFEGLDETGSTPRQRTRQ